jgi:hypothetical protein
MTSGRAFLRSISTTGKKDGSRKQNKSQNRKQVWMMIQS